MHQAAHGNVRHGLITGDSGVGKSSLSSQLQGIARGETSYLSLLPHEYEGLHFNFVVAEYTAQDGHSIIDIVNGLLDELDRAQQKKAASLKVKTTIDLKLLKFELDDAARPPQDLVASFIDQLCEAWDKLSDHFDGILLVIDELDRIASNYGVPTFFKTVTEMMTKRELESVILLPVGISTVEETLKQGHQSVPRIFKKIKLMPLDSMESLGVIDRALNDSHVSIEATVAAEIARLARGIPNQIHLLGSAAFDATEEAKINEESLIAGINVVIADQRDYLEKLWDLTGEGTKRSIAIAMSEYPEENVPLRFIEEKLPFPSATLTSFITTLKKLGIVVSVSRGLYKFNEPLFKYYVRSLQQKLSQTTE